MHFYSLHYFRKATALRPYDARMWCAMGQCYECLEKYSEAVKCYSRAHECGDREGIALNKLGKLYAQVMDDPAQAALYYEQNLALLDAEQVAPSTLNSQPSTPSSQPSTLNPQPSTLNPQPEQVEGQQTMDALLFLARHLKDPLLGRLGDAEVFCQRLHQGFGQDKEEVTALMKEIRQVYTYIYIHINM